MKEEKSSCGLSFRKHFAASAASQALAADTGVLM